ncbi:MAG: hypothetical protein WC822_01680 [Candidatus Paceibacterota bacterium]|jgi:hypothetical protein
MLKKEIKISYQNRHGVRGDLPTAPKLVLANHILEKVCNIAIGDKVSVEYSPNLIVIKKLT